MKIIEYIPLPGGNIKITKKPGIIFSLDIGITHNILMVKSIIPEGVFMQYPCGAKRFIKGESFFDIFNQIREEASRFENNIRLLGEG